MEVERCPLWRDKVTLVEKEVSFYFDHYENLASIQIKIECVKGSDPHAVIEVESTSNEDVYGRVTHSTISTQLITLFTDRIRKGTHHFFRQILYNQG